MRERRFDLVRQELLAELRRERIEPPTDGRIERMVRSALHLAEQDLCARVHSRLPADVVARLEELAAADDDGPSLLATIKAVPGNVSLDSMLAEIEKLRAARAVGVPAAALADVAPKVVAGWRARAMVEAPSHLARHTPALRVTLLRLREREVTNALAELLICDQRANRRVQAGDRQGEPAVPHRGGGTVGAGVAGPRRRVPRRVGWGADVAGGGGGAPQQEPDVPAHGEDVDARLVHQPLPQGPDPQTGHQRERCSTHAPAPVKIKKMAADDTIVTGTP